MKINNILDHDGNVISYIHEKNSFFTDHIAIIAAAFFIVYKYALIIFPSIITNDLTAAFHLNATQLGNLAACFFYAYIITQLIAGSLLDYFSVQNLSSIAILSCAFGCYLFSQADSLIIADTGRCLMGIGASFASLSYMKLASCKFSDKKFTILAGFLASSAMLGSLCGTLLLSSLVDQQGWRQTILYCSWFGVALAILYWKSTPNALNSSEEAQDLKTLTLNLAKLIQKPSNWLLAIYCGFVFAPIDVFAGLWGPAFLKLSYNLSKSEAIRDTSLIFLGLFIGAPVLAMVANRIQNKLLTMKISTLIAFITLALIIYFPEISKFFLPALLLIYGVGTSCVMLAFVISKETNTLKMTATVIAILNSIEALYGGISDVLTGKLLDISASLNSIHSGNHFLIKDYQTALSILAVGLALALPTLILIKKIINSGPKIVKAEDETYAEINQMAT